jgi:molybdenum cofactor cytidylyltransferase
MRNFAIIPAAGHSVRMGRPKLLLPLAGQPLIRHVVDAWLQSRVDAILVVVRSDDAALAAAIPSASDSRILLVRPLIPPPDMKASIQAALREIERTLQPAADDAFLVAPADMPALSPAVIGELLTQRPAHSTHVLVPTREGLRGHPVLCPWPLAAEVHALSAEEGLNAVVHRHPPVEIACDHLPALGGDPFADLDTPEQYRRLTGEQG